MINMLSLTILAMAVAVTSAFPRGELGVEEGNLYPGLYRDQTMEDKEGRNLDTLDGVIVEPIYGLRPDKKEGGTLDSLGGGHLIRNLKENEDNYEHEIKKEALKTKFHTDTSKAFLPNKLSNTNHFISKSLESVNGRSEIMDQHLLRNLVYGKGRRFKRDFLDGLGGGHLLRDNIDPFVDVHPVKGTSKIPYTGPISSDGDQQVSVNFSNGRHFVREFLDPLGGGHLIRGIDSIGGGHLLRGLDAKENGNLGKELTDGFRSGYSISGGPLVREFLDPLGGGHLIRGLDSKSGDHFKREFLDPLGGGHLIRGLDSIGGGHLVREFLDPLGGGHLIRGLDSKGGDHFKREFLDPLGGGHLIRGLDSIGGGHLVREFLDPLGGGHLIRGLDSEGDSHP
ncbi:uncharacterized protein isoform X1 [Rhodnius prolixus]|uniref:Orcokinin isoform B n=1 Tax=Rhodnius prolixus TaxID=13249 RepID=G3FVM1_RHOPR|nr:orcokinin precursor isoform B [Rhodnius prolixus]